ncbi:hypothetical protein F183_A45970 [Bryobacterales bacterium F-183]|nr:hypothetical protein F183_A45970 [Bryobacterales bacterium F-183]
MSPAELHKRTAEIFDDALQLPPHERASFLNLHCTDPDVRRRVERMLLAEEAAPSGFLEKPALQAAAEMLAERSATQNLTGKTLGNYRIEQQIGAGGMGTVYAGLDLRLNRKVAVKVLPSLYVADPDRVRRFEQEARAASLLNHPNIVSIFDAGHDAGTGLHYIAIEFVEGETLREILQRVGWLDAKELTETAIQICSALSAAHKAGIFHRDIKPENIMVRPDGIVKVLDFGLAKLTEGATSLESHSNTRAGHVAGTVHYLSPEQVLGKTVDARSDLFSLGVVLYELATGSRPFQGPTDGAIFEAILHKVPEPPSSIQSELSPALEQIILHGLEKDPDLRYQSAGDIRAALKRLDRDSRSGFPAVSSDLTPAPANRSNHRTVALAVLGTALAMLLPMWWWKNRTEQNVGQQPFAFERVTAEPNEEIYPTLSPDGSQMVFASARSGNWDIYLQRVGGQTPVNLTKDFPDDDTEPAISPDGKRIAFYSRRDGGGLFVMEVTGENPRKLWDKGHAPSWSPDGKQLAVADEAIENPSRVGPRGSRLHIISLETGNIATLTEPVLGFQPQWSPDGRRLAYWTLPELTGRRDVFTVAVNGSSPPVALTNDPPLDWNPEWSLDGRHMYFLSDRGGTMNIWRVEIDPASGQAAGAPTPMTSPSKYVKHFRLSRDGKSFVYVASEGHAELLSAGLAPGARSLTSKPTLVGDATPSVNGFMISPDETKIVFDNLGDPQEDLWIMNIDGTGRRRLTNDRFRDLDPAWSPDGKKIAFYSDRDGKKYNIWTIFADGSGLQQLTRMPGEELPMAPAFTHDGRGLMFFPWLGAARIVYEGKSAIEYLRGFPKPDYGWIFLQPRNPPPDPRDARDWLGYERQKTGDPLIVRYNSETGDIERLDIQGSSPAWMPGHKQIIFVRGPRVMSYDLSTKAETELFSPYPNRPVVLRVNKDGSRVYFTVAVREGDIWVGRFPDR